LRSWLEVFRPEEGHQQVAEQPEAYCDQENVFEHGRKRALVPLFQMFTAAKIENRDHEEEYGCCGERYVCHKYSFPREVARVLLLR
jgi:hypothetical protein